MKTIKLLTLAIILTLASCTPESNHCNNCDYVIEPIIFNNSGTEGTYNVKNDCTGIIKTKSFTGAPPKLGECTL